MHLVQATAQFPRRSGIVDARLPPPTPAVRPPPRGALQNRRVLALVAHARAPGILRRVLIVVGPVLPQMERDQDICAQLVATRPRPRCSFAQA